MCGGGRCGWRRPLWAEVAGPALLIPRACRAIAPSLALWGFTLGPVLVLPLHILGVSLGASVAAAPLLGICQKAQELLLAWQLWPPSPFPALGCPLGPGGRRVVGTTLRHGRSRSYRKDNC